MRLLCLLFSDVFSDFVSHVLFVVCVYTQSRPDPHMISSPDELEMRGACFIYFDMATDELEINALYNHVSI
jgi:hypothetical protein